MSASLIGRKLGKYDIVQLLGQGGMATVYKGYHPELDRYAAIKVLPPHPGRTSQYVRRFHQEARTIARLHHPNILTLYDYGTEDDILYLAMAYVEGGSLSDLIRAGGLPLERIEQLLNEIASALNYAHQQEVIHRDIKPGNILLDKEGHGLLADFGIAKSSTSNSTLTGVGGVVGTPAYMAPEQSQGEITDQRADIYALGALTYELLTGRPPYQNENSLRLILMHITDPVPNIMLVRPDLPPGLEDIMQRVLAKLPANRYPTALSFYEVFRDAVQGSTFLTTATHSIYKVPSETMHFVPPAVRDSTETDQRLLTFLLTDIEGSTQLWEQHPEAMSLALAHHDSVMFETIETYQGTVYKTVGDGVYAVFDSAVHALEAALSVQSALHQVSTRTNAPLLPLKVRMGLYSGQVEKRGNDYFGSILNRASRLMDAAHGNQILISETTQQLLPAETELRDLGMHRLRDVNQPEHIFQAVSAHVTLNTNRIRSLTPRPTNLPAQLTSFVGREQNVEDICGLLRQPNVRLLTLLGPGGIGKTRLSIQIGTSLLDEYEDGVFFIPLAPLSQAEAVVKFIARTLNVQEDASTPLLDAIKAHINTRQLLLIFDNFEHILDAATLVNELLVAAARVKILVTSRESLFIYGERPYTVPPLGVPATTEGFAQLQRSSAVKLFVERVQAFQSEFSLSEANAANVVKICQQLDGLPLALELAAARVRDLTLQEIAEQLTQQLALLSKGPRDFPIRQQTMRGAIAWSYDLLAAED